MAWDQDDLEQIMNREITKIRGWKIYLLSYLLSFTNSWQVSTTEHGAYYYGLVTVPPPWERYTTTQGTTPLSLYKQCVGYLMFHRFYTCQGCETGPTVYCPYLRGLEGLITEPFYIWYFQQNWSRDDRYWCSNDLTD